MICCRCWDVWELNSFVVSFGLLFVLSGWVLVWSWVVWCSRWNFWENWLWLFVCCWWFGCRFRLVWVCSWRRWCGLGWLLLIVCVLLKVVDSGRVGLFGCVVIVVCILRCWWRLCWLGSRLWFFWFRCSCCWGCSVWRIVGRWWVLLFRRL